mmetsp:Transcript_41661/g.75623  ORF Transcript_41661/g.75623 Transcript_41661/m.75623 type:complete len:756 (+) Transcript_41661:57-2324(+)
MAFRGVRDTSILVVDVGKSMRDSINAGEGSKVCKAEYAMSLAQAALKQKVLFLPRHEVGLIFFGTVESKNDLVADGYENVYVANAGMDAANMSMLRAIAAPPAGGAQSDAVNGLIVALDMLYKRTAGTRCNKTIRLLTDDSSIAAGDPDIAECVKQAEATETKVQVTLLGDTPAKAWPSVAEASNWVEIVSPSVLAQRCGMSVKPVEQRAKVRLSLELSPSLHIPVGIYSKTTSVRLPTLKTRSRLAGGVDDALRKTERVIVEHTYHVADDPDGEEVKLEERIKGHRYGQSIVPMSAYDEAALMYTCERTLMALCFVPAVAIRPEHSTRHVDAVAPDKGDAWAQVALDSLITAMLEDDKVLVCRYCMRKNAQPIMVALVPNSSHVNGAKSLDMQFLPFAEDIRDWSFRSFPEVTAPQRDCIGSLLDSMRLDKPSSEKPSGQPAKAPEAELFRPEDLPNPMLQRFYSFLVARALEPGAKLSPPSAELMKLIDRPPQVTTAIDAGKVAEKLKATFGLEKVEKTTKRTRKFWREAIAEKRKDVASTGEVDIKRIKVAMKEEKKEEDEEKDRIKLEPGDARPHDAGMAVPGIAAPIVPEPEVAPRVHIGSVHPERDLDLWLSHRTGGVDVVGLAVTQMQNVIRRFIDEGEAFHAKALSCLNALRAGCVREGEASSYNEFARALRCSVTKLGMIFWDRARTFGVSLITDAEVPTSTVNLEEAKAFLRGEDAAASSSARRSSDSAAGGALMSERELEAMIE